jgi:hypothetical protein
MKPTRFFLAAALAGGLSLAISRASTDAPAPPPSFARGPADPAPNDPSSDRPAPSTDAGDAYALAYEPPTTALFQRPSRYYSEWPTGRPLSLAKPWLRPLD